MATREIGRSKWPLAPQTLIWRVRTAIYLAILSALSMVMAFWLRFDLSLHRGWVGAAGVAAMAGGARRARHQPPRWPLVLRIELVSSAQVLSSVWILSGWPARFAKSA